MEECTFMQRTDTYRKYNWLNVNANICIWQMNFNNEQPVFGTSTHHYASSSRMTNILYKILVASQHIREHRYLFSTQCLRFFFILNVFNFKEHSCLLEIKNTNSGYKIEKQHILNEFFCQNVLIDSTYKWQYTERILVPLRRCGMFNINIIQI